ncbi:hypothetical protein VNO77_24890 [Canavalia gladiata]|uniref:Uncharacterized protein n=1 Tax=Canavalia gladiata TaxID=3824 RepID=A0AAN9QD15_CANGL
MRVEQIHVRLLHFSDECQKRVTLFHALKCARGKHLSGDGDGTRVPRTKPGLDDWRVCYTRQLKLQNTHSGIRHVSYLCDNLF